VIANHGRYQSWSIPTENYLPQQQKQNNLVFEKQAETDRALLLAFCLNSEEVESYCIIKLPISRSGGGAVSLYQQQQGDIHRPEIK
jgi:hypothetical protein